MLTNLQFSAFEDIVIHKKNHNFLTEKYKDLVDCLPNYIVNYKYHG